MTMGTASTMTSRRRGAGHDAARRRLDPGARIPTTSGWRRPPAAASSRWSGRTSGRRASSTSDVVRERGDAWSWRSGGSTNAVIHLIAMARPRWHPARPRRLRPHLAPDAGARQPPPLGQVPDGGLLLRRRPAGADARHARPAARRLPHRQRPAAAPRTSRTRDVYNDDVIRPLRQPAVARRRARWCCAATSRPTARSSSTPPPTRTCSQHTRPRGHLRRLRRPARRASTTPTSTSTQDDVLVLAERRPARRRRACPSGAMLPIPKKLLQAGRARHGAHLRRAHERHQLTAPACCTSRPSRPSADRSAWSRTATSSSSTWRRAASTCWFRRRSWRAGGPPGARRPPYYSRGYGALFAGTSCQADEGCDFDFLTPAGETPEPKIY